MIGYVFLLEICLLAKPTSGSMALNCQKAFPTSTLTKNYNETIAHAIHSMTVAGLRVFSPKASANNFVPTVNQDLSQEQTVLDHAPEHVLGHDFSTLTMNIIDNILSNLGNSMDGLGPHWSPVERVTHVFHMWDLWYRIKESAWPRVQKTPPTDEMCTCLASVEFNGIKDAVQWVANHYKTGTSTSYLLTLLNQPIPKLTDAVAWGDWKQRLLHYYTPEALQDAAMYLHCVSQFW